MWPLAAVTLVVWSSTLLYVDLIWFLAGNAVENYYFASSVWLNPWVFPGNLDVILNMLGMLIVCGFNLGVGKQMKGWRKYMPSFFMAQTTSKGGAYSAASSNQVGPSPPLNFDSKAYDDDQK